MSNMTVPSNQDNSSFVKRVLAPFVTFIAMFVGAGFISGGIVHLGDGFNWWDVSLLGFGVLLFVTGSYIQESIYNKKNLKDGGVLLFLVYSLLLSIGIGMASGGLQHFVDTPGYSTYLIPIGLSIGLVAFILKQNIKLPQSQWLKLIPGALILALLLGSGLSYAARSMPTSWRQSGHTHNSESEGTDTHDVMGHVEVNSDADFLVQMIPHHQEAVDTSAYVLTRTENSDLHNFSRGVIDAQTREILQMKEWQRKWYADFSASEGSYEPMMGDLTRLKGQALDQVYIQGMIEHHRGAVIMADRIKSITQRPEIKKMAEDIIRTQNLEIRTLEGWLTGISVRGMEDSQAGDVHAH